MLKGRPVMCEFQVNSEQLSVYLHHRCGMGYTLNKKNATWKAVLYSTSWILAASASCRGHCKALQKAFPRAPCCPRKTSPPVWGLRRSLLQDAPRLLSPRGGGRCTFPGGLPPLEPPPASRLFPRSVKSRSSVTSGVSSPPLPAPLIISLHEQSPWIRANL